MAVHPTTASPLDIVLDTNVVLDWLVFNDPAAAVIDTALVSQTIRVLTCAHAIDELERVLSYPSALNSGMRAAAELQRSRTQRSQCIH